MSLPEPIELGSADFITIDTIGVPGQRTFFLQAAEGDMIITLVIEKEHAAALAIALRSLLEQLGQGQAETDDTLMPPVNLDLIYPVEPLFRVGQLGMGYDETQDMIVIMAEELTEEEQQSTKVHIWGNRAMMGALAHQAATVVASGRPICSLCGEVMDVDKHVCIKGNGRKRLYKSEN
ncbi:MAG: DUF3090 family protein [Chloroflexi bacterium]|nr:DUF3090 family protein [Chloroflexota bacterium]